MSSLLISLKSRLQECAFKRWKYPKQYNQDIDTHSNKKEYPGLCPMKHKEKSKIRAEATCCVYGKV